MVKRIVYIDALKAFAIILVVIGHLSAMCGGGDNMIYEVIASFHMPLFLFLSGFVLKRIPTSFKLLHKCFALLLPMMTIGVILTIFIHHHSVKDMCYDSFKGGYWYLYMLVVYYLLIQPTKFFINRTFLLGLYIVGVFCLLKGLAVFSPLDVKGLFSLDMMNGLWLYFAFGFLLAHSENVKHFVFGNAILSLALVSFIPLFVLYHNQTLVRFAQILPFTAILACVFIFKKFFAEENKFVKQVSFIGQNTLDIYIYHYFLLPIININSLGLWGLRTGNYLLELVMLLLLALLVAYISIAIGKIIRLSHILNIIVYGNIHSCRLKDIFHKNA